MRWADIDWRPSDRTVRQFAGFGLLAAGVVAARLGWTGKTTAAFAVAAAGVVLAVVGWFAPRIVRPLFVAATVAAFPIGWVVSHVVLAVLYYGVVTSIGLLLRLFRRDPLPRRFDAAAETYWAPVESPPRDRYFQQF